MRDGYVFGVVQLLEDLHYHKMQFTTSENCKSGLCEAVNALLSMNLTVYLRIEQVSRGFL
jgi:hypothetical protein